ncbi:hypothetical protein [Rhizobium sp. AN83]|uniref:hypothetical protein n=1 Tax=Rhizobium sp. AN83 TaxID=3035217 RepID=UPI002B263B1D|nr:hypothetical protein [Rhizobium sp. AN83]
MSREKRIAVVRGNAGHGRDCDEFLANPLKSIVSLCIIGKAMCDVRESFDPDGSFDGMFDGVDA